MNNLPRFFAYATKVISAVVITAAIVAVLSILNKGRQGDSSSHFNALRESLISAIRPERAENEIVPDSTPEITPENSSTIPSLPATNEIEVKEEDKFELARERETVVTEKATVKLDQAQIESLPKKESANPGSWIRTEVMKAIPFGKMDDMNLKLNKFDLQEFDFEFESLDDLISIALEFGVNDIPLEEKQFNTIIQHLQNAENDFNIKKLDIRKIVNMGERVASFISLNGNIKRITQEYEALPECQFHKPVLDINKDLEIVGYYQEFDCHPELVATIMESIKALPEWKKLVKKVYSP